MDNLPKELLIEIFTFLPSSDLHTLTLVCKKFNEIISNSSKICKKFELQLIQSNVNLEFVKNRKISRIFLDGSVAKHFIFIFPLIASEIDEITIDCYEIEVVILKQILFICGSVKNLTIFNIINSSEDECDFREPLPRINFENFYFQGEIDVFRIFQHCTARVLDIRRDYDDESRNVDGLRKFLSVQTNLEVLKFENFDRNSSIFAEFSDAKFKLKKLKLKYFDDYNSFNFKNFLESQKETLLSLEVLYSHHDLLTLFRNFRNLNNLKIFNICSGFDKMPYIETLQMKEIDGNWSEKFPNCKKLTIIEEADDIAQVEKMKFLENLKVKNCEISNLNLPTVKSLTLFKVNSKSPINIEKATSIEELKIEKSKNLEWLSEFLIHKNFKLKTLKIFKSKINDEDLKFIEDFKNNRIDDLEIINCKNLTDDDIDDDYEEYFDDESSRNEFGDDDFSENDEEDDYTEDDVSGEESQSDADDENDGNQQQDEGVRRRNV